MLYFKIEVVGLMDSFPYLVIQGIYDYTNTHKNKRWQPYAAAVAVTVAYTNVMGKQKQAPRGPIGPIYGQIEDLRANSPEDPTQCFCPRGGVWRSG